MVKQVTFNDHEREIRPRFRMLTDSAESTEDVRKQFERAARDFLGRALGPEWEIGEEDVLFDPETDAGYVLSQALLGDERFATVLGGSDLGPILERLARKAVNRFRQLEKNPGKTEAKMYPIPGNR